MARKVLIIGATSAIAEATARRFCRGGARLFLLARNRERLDTLARDLNIRGAESVDCETLDARDFGRHQATLEKAVAHMGGVDIVLIAHGTLPDQKACEGDFDLALEDITVNALGTLSLLTHLARILELQGYGTLAVIGSVAGERGRKSNYVYGSSKAMVATFLQGLRNRLHGAGVHVLTIKPGIVDTPMTAGLKKGLLWAQPETVARGIAAAIERKKEVVYLPWFWRFIMLVIRSMPERLFKRTDF